MKVLYTIAKCKFIIVSAVLVLTFQFQLTADMQAFAGIGVYSLNFQPMVSMTNFLFKSNADIIQNYLRLIMQSGEIVQVLMRSATTN